MNKELTANTTLSHYRVVSKIGEGGMGEVWLAEDTRLGRKVALKLLATEFSEDSERVRRFTQEAKAASALNHPNIISVYDIGECETGRFIVMEFVAGHTLRSVIATDNSLETFFTLAAQMAKALSAAHAAGIAHRDIKPDNIMVRDDGYVKVLDFGLARLLPTTSSDPEAATLAQQTTPGTVMGTLAYMSPEQASGQTAGSGSDVFALGIVLYELATGSHPFKSETMIGYLHAITLQTPPSLTSIKSHLPIALDDLVLRMLEKDAVNRPTASAVVQALQEIEKYGSSNTLPFRVAADKPKVAVAEEGFWIEVLPFKTTAANQELHTLAEGLKEEIVTGLSRFAYLRVVARSSSLRQGSLTNSSGQQRNARYLIEGSIRQAGSALRVSVQLVDTITGTHLWAEAYDRPYRSEDIFALQDELVPRIVSTVADQHGVLVHCMAEVTRNKRKDQFTPYEAVLSVFGFHERMTPQEHLLLREILERVVREHPDQGNCWAMLETLYADEHMFGFNVLPDSLGRALNAAQRAVELAPTSNLASQALAQAYFFRRELNAFRPVAERTIALNPMDTATVAVMGLFIACSGDWERGCAIAESAMALNPIFPGWYRCAHLFDAYRRFDYEAAVDVIGRINIPGYYWTLLMSAATLGQLGQTDRAKKSLTELLTNRPDFVTAARDDLNKWFEADLVEHLLEGLRKAGLKTSDEEPAATSSSAARAANVTRADEGFWVAVLPFKFTGANAAVATLAEGLSEEISTGLSRFSYLRVIARSSTARYASEISDVRTVGQQLNARYVMEGSLRHAGSSLRVSVQLVDSNTGTQLWAESYDRPFRAEEIFALQDDLVPRIVSTAADINGVLPRSMCEVVCSRNPETLSPYEAVLRSFRYFDRVTAEELCFARSGLELAVEKAPTLADAWAMLALLYCQDYGQGFNLQSDSLARGITAAQRAVESGPANHLAHFSLAQARFFQKDFQSFRNAAERAVALNPMDANSLAFMGELLTYVGDSKRGLELAAHAKQINPNHPGWFWYADFFHTYRQGDYRGALSLILKANLPGHWGMHAGIAAANGQLGEHEAASKAVRDLLKLRPDYGVTAHNTLAKWFDPELCEQLLDGLRKAGLEIANERTEGH